MTLHLNFAVCISIVNRLDSLPFCSAWSVFQSSRVSSVSVLRSITAGHECLVLNAIAKCLCSNTRFSIELGHKIERAQCLCTGQPSSWQQSVRPLMFAAPVNLHKATSWRCHHYAWISFSCYRYPPHHSDIIISLFCVVCWYCQWYVFVSFEAVFQPCHCPWPWVYGHYILL